MMEAVRLIDRLLTEDAVDWSGPYYTVRGARLRPKRPRPPLMIGGGGPRILRLAAAHADIIALNPQFNADGHPVLSDLTTGATLRKIKVLQAALGDRFAKVELNVFIVGAGVSDEPRIVVGADATRLKGAAAQLVDSPFFLYGSLADLKRQLLERREHVGMSYVGLPSKSFELFAPLVRELGGR